MVRDRRHALAAGLTGSVQVTHATPMALHWGRPGPLASWVLVQPGPEPRDAVFAYERGTPIRYHLRYGDWGQATPTNGRTMVPHNGLLVGLANAMGAPTDTFGDPQYGGELPGLRG